MTPVEALTIMGNTPIIDLLVGLFWMVAIPTVVIACLVTLFRALGDY
jgi:hypothetical protein